MRAGDQGILSECPQAYEAVCKQPENTEEEQWINENGNNNILELEMASKEFKGLLRKIKALKIDIYEKELARQKTELEAMQMQIKPHFI